MSHEIDRLLRAFAAEPLFIDPRKAAQIVALLDWRAKNGPRAEPYRQTAASRGPIARRRGQVEILQLFGTIMPRAELLADISEQTAPMVDFQRQFRLAAGNAENSAIVLEIHSPGGRIDMVPETAAMVRNARKPGRPIVAVVNTLAASAAYWIASQADEVVVAPSGEVGSIGVYMVHEDVSDFLKKEGVRVTFISEGPRKVEGNPFEPLSAEARGALQANVKYFYDLFVNDVARGRNVPASVVRADPEKEARHFGGGRVYPGHLAVALGMADRVATLEATVARLRKGTATVVSGASSGRSPATIEANTPAPNTAPMTDESLADFLRSYIFDATLSEDQKRAVAKYKAERPGAFKLAQRLGRRRPGEQQAAKPQMNGETVAGSWDRAIARANGRVD